MSFYDLNAKFRPIDRWPGERTRNRRWARFEASWSSTVDLLGRELRHLGAKNILCLMALRDRDIRLDGYPRADARPTHPGIVISFDSKYGPLKYACDTFTDWQDNVRAIALGLEALRKVDRYGITKRGEQYRGWKALPSPERSAAERGRDLIRKHGGLKNALRATHPDHGGNAEDFHAVQVARAD